MVGAGLLIMSMGVGSGARADECAKLAGQGDTYWFCRAQGSGSDANCASIRDSTLRRTCLSLTRGNPGECASIPNSQRAAKINCQQRGR
jgi:hypothetical protein